MGELHDQSAKPYDLFISYVEGDKAWVEGYLLEALDRAEIEYHSEQAFDLGRPRLLEFERAIEQSRRVLLVLSPAYLSDGFGQFTDVLAQHFGIEAGTWPVIPVQLHSIKMPSRLQMLVGLDATNRKNWPDVIERLCDELEKPVPGPTPRPPCPYPGMIPFTDKQADRFFGRDAEIKTLRHRLRHENILFVIGPSGCGKSSLVFAGLIPELRVNQPDRWLVRTMRPAASPREALAETLEASEGASNVGLQAVEALLDVHGREKLLLVVDQFEELFTQSRKVEQSSFIERLHALREVDECALVLTMRADYYPDLMRSEIWNVAKDHRFEIIPLHGEKLRAAIEEPSREEGVYVEAALLERLLSDAAEEPGVLPLLQETMNLLWEEMERRLLPVQAYEDLGTNGRSGLEVALAMVADAVYTDMTSGQQRIAQRVLLRLVQFGEGRPDTRRQRRLSELRGAQDDLGVFDEVIEQLSTSRLITLSGEAEAESRRVDLSHEALIEGWPRLRKWLQKLREAEQVRRRLENEADKWERLGREGGLLDVVELREAEAWAASEAAAELGGFSGRLAKLVAASRAAIEEQKREEEAARQRELEQAKALADEQQRRAEIEARRAEEQTRAAKKLRYRFVAAAGLAAVALVAAVLAYYWLKRANEEARVATSRALAAQAMQSLEQRPGRALLLAVEASRVDDNGQSRSSLHAALRRSERVRAFLWGRTSSVTSVSYSPNGKLLAAGGEDGTVWLWDVETEKAIATLESHAGYVRVAFSPNGKLLATGGEDGKIRLWSVKTRKPIDTLEHAGEVNSVAFSSNEELLASGGEDGKIRLWDVETRKPIDTLEVHADDVISVAFSPNGKLLASGGEDGKIRLWDVETRKPIDTLEPADGVMSVAFSPNGKLLASGGWEGKVRLWSVETRKQIDSLEVHDDVVYNDEIYDVVYNVEFSPDGDLLAAMSQGGKLFSSAGTDVRLWSVETRKPIDTLRGHDASVWGAFTSDEELLVSEGGGGALELWDVETERAIAALEGQDNVVYNDVVYDVAFSPDGGLLAWGGKDSTAWLWDVETEKVIATLKHAGGVSSVAFSPDGKLVATGSWDGTARLWDVETEEAVATLGHADGVNSVAFSPDGKLVATGSWDDTARLWDVETEKVIATLEHARGVNSVAFSPDGELLASRTVGTVRLWRRELWRRELWRREEGQPVATLEQSTLVYDDHEDNVIRLMFSPHVAFSPDGKLVATGSWDGTARLWDVETEEAVATLEHAGEVNSVAFSPDGKLVATGSDGTVRLWWREGWQSVATLGGQESTTRSVAFRPPDGELLATGSTLRAAWVTVDGTVRLSDLRISAWRNRACRKANRNLTQDEWDQFISSKIPFRCTCPQLPPGEGTELETCPDRD